MTEPSDPRPNYPSYPTGDQQQAFEPYGPATVVNRPGTVLAAVIITIVLSALTLLTSVLILATRNSLATSMHNYLRDHHTQLNIKPADIPTDAPFRTSLTVAAVILAIVGLIGVSLAILTLARRNWARILLIVAASLTAVAAILPSTSLVGIPWLAGAIAVLSLLLTKRSKAWFAAPKIG